MDVLILHHWAEGSIHKREGGSRLFDPSPAVLQDVGGRAYIKVCLLSPLPVACELACPRRPPSPAPASSCRRRCRRCSRPRLPERPLRTAGKPTAIWLCRGAFYLVET